MTSAGSAGRRPTRREVRRALPVVFLLLSLAVAAFGALEAYHAQRSHRATARSVLTDYGEFALWSYGQRVNELLTTSLDRTFAVVRQNTAFAAGTATRQCLALLLEDPIDAESCGCEPPITGRFSFHVRLDAPPADAEWAGRPPAGPERDRLVAAVRRHARRDYGEGWRFAVVHGDGGATVAYVRLVTRGLDPGMRPASDTLVYGVELDRTRIADVMARALGEDIVLPPSLTRGRPNREVIQVDVRDPSGATLYASAPEIDHAFPGEDDLFPALGGGTIRASVLPSVADQLVIGGLPEDHTPVLLLIFGLAAALAVGAIVQLRRENRLALLRQDFVASVSHELRTPLAQVRLFTETLRLGRTRNGDQREWALENIDRETLRLTHLVENILHFSRSERGLASVQREATDLADEVREALAAFRPLVPAHRARFECDVPDGLLAEVHRDSFRQVLLNFLDNAVRYGPSGQTIRLEGERDGQRVRIAVLDEGPGIPTAERETVFEPFRRGDSAVGTVVPGSGIGLSVVREIARAHQGRVWVDDAPGGGARFVLELAALHTASSRHFRGQPSPSVATAGAPGTPGAPEVGQGAA